MRLWVEVPNQKVAILVEEMEENSLIACVRNWIEFGSGHIAKTFTKYNCNWQQISTKRTPEKCNTHLQVAMYNAKRMEMTNTGSDLQKHISRCMGDECFIFRVVTATKVSAVAFLPTRLLFAPVLVFAECSD